MKIIGAEKEMEFIKVLLDAYSYDCNDCPYTEGCRDEGKEVCSEHILKYIKFEQS